MPHRRSTVAALLLIMAALPFVALPSPRPPAKPAFLLNLKEVSRLGKLPDGRLIAVFVRSVGGEPELAARYSNDNGQTWGEAETLTQLPKDERGWGSPEPLVDRRGELQVFFLKDAPQDAHRAGHRYLALSGIRSPVPSARNGKRRGVSGRGTPVR